MEEKDVKKSFFVKDTKLAVDLYISIVVFIIAIVFLVSASGLPTKTKGIGAGVYPTVICILLLVLSLLQFTKTLLLSKGFPIPDFAKTDNKGILRVCVMAVVTYLFYKLLKIVGFPILAPIYLFFTICFFGYKKKVKAAIISVIFTTVVYLLFTKVFLVMLPAGILG